MCLWVSKQPHINATFYSNYQVWCQVSNSSGFICWCESIKWSTWPFGSHTITHQIRNRSKSFHNCSSDALFLPCTWSPSDDSLNLVLPLPWYFFCLLFLLNNLSETWLQKTKAGPHPKFLRALNYTLKNSLISLDVNCGPLSESTSSGIP